MRKTASPILLFAALVVLRSRDASAAGTAGVLIGEGFTDGYNLGIGARAGYSFATKLYLGGTFVYHFGKEYRSLLGGDLHVRVLYLGAEGGYDFAAGPLTIRPYVGLGVANARDSIMDLSATSLKAVIWPGVAALVPIGSLFVGADARFITIIHGVQGNAISIFGVAGVAF